MTTCLGKSCSFGLPRVPFVNYCQFIYLVISLLVLRAGYGLWLYQFLIIVYLFTLCMISWWTSAGKVLTSSLPACAVLLYAVLIVSVPFSLVV